MSCIVSVERKSDESSSISKYEVTAYRADAAWGLGPLEFELDRKSILTDFEKLLPVIMTSSIRFRSVIKFEEIQKDPLDTLIALGKRTYSALSVDVRQAIKSADSIHLFTNEIEIPWELMHGDENFISLKKPFGISPMIKTRYPERQLGKKVGRLRALIVVDTKNNLPQTRYETEKIISLMADNAKVDHMVLKGNEATYSRVRYLLQKDYFDIIHVAAHAKYEHTTPEDSGVPNTPLQGTKQNESGELGRTFQRIREQFGCIRTRTI
jgi:CHAT domain